MVAADVAAAVEVADAADAVEWFGELNQSKVPSSVRNDEKMARRSRGIGRGNKTKNGR
jgi:hypothetical protein